MKTLPSDMSFSEHQIQGGTQSGGTMAIRFRYYGKANTLSVGISLETDSTILLQSRELPQNLELKDLESLKEMVDEAIAAVKRENNLRT